MEADFENLCKILDLSPDLRGPPIARAGEARQVHRGEHGGRGPARRRRPGARAGGAPRTVAALQDAPTARRQHGHRGVPAQRGQIHTEWEGFDSNNKKFNYLQRYGWAPKLRELTPGP